MKDLMRIKWLLVLALLFAGGLQAKNNADVLLKKTMKRMTSYQNFKANLSYTMNNKKMNIHEEKNGTIYVEGNKFRIELSGQIIISDGKNVWTILKDSKEIMLTAVDPSDPSGFSPTNILKRYSNYKVSFERHAYGRRSLFKTLVLTTKKETNFKKVTVTINKAKLILKDFSLYDNQGNIFTYHISNFKPNLKLPAGTFTFRPQDFPGYGKPEDMR